MQATDQENFADVGSINELLNWLKKAQKLKHKKAKPIRLSKFVYSQYFGWHYQPSSGVQMHA